MVWHIVEKNQIVKKTLEIQFKLTDKMPRGFPQFISFFSLTANRRLVSSII